MSPKDSNNIPSPKGSITVVTVLQSRPATMACLMYSISCTGLTLINKVVFSKASFNYPWFTLAFQNILSTIIILATSATGMIKRIKWSKKLAREMAVPIVFFVGFIFSNAVSLRYMSLPLLTVFKSLSPLGLTIVERSYFGDTFSKEVYLSMILIIISTLITCFYDLEFSAQGYFWALFNVFTNIGYIASLRLCVSDTNFSNLDKTVHSNVLSLIPVIPISFLQMELPTNVWSAFATMPWSFLCLFILSGVFTLALCVSSFWTIQVTNGATLSFVGGLNKIPIVLFGALLFDTNINVQGWCGIVVGLIAGLTFITSKQRVAKFKSEHNSTQASSTIMKTISGGSTIVMDSSPALNPTKDGSKHASHLSAPLINSNSISHTTVIMHSNSNEKNSILTPKRSKIHANEANVTPLNSPNITPDLTPLQSNPYNDRTMPQTPMLPATAFN